MCSQYYPNSSIWTKESTYVKNLEIILSLIYFTILVWLCVRARGKIIVIDEYESHSRTSYAGIFLEQLQRRRDTIINRRFIIDLGETRGRASRAHKHSVAASRCRWRKPKCDCRVTCQPCYWKYSWRIQNGIQFPERRSSVPSLPWVSRYRPETGVEGTENVASRKYREWDVE